IAIGTIVDMGVVLTENILTHIRGTDTAERRLEAVFRGASEVGGAVLTAVLTTVVSFLPVFAMEGAEGKLFKPLAYTKTFALLASIAVSLAVIPPLAHLLLRARPGDGARRDSARRLPIGRAATYLLAALVVVILAHTWEPLGPVRQLGNLAFTAMSVGGALLLFHLFHRAYVPLLRLCLTHRKTFLCLPIALVACGSAVWFGFDRLLGFVPPSVAAVTGGRVTADAVRTSSAWRALSRQFPGLGKEFMPRLDEGSFLLMPIVMYHASITEALEMLQKQDTLLGAIPEVECVVGKIGRVDSALDPAPIGMVETIIRYKPEYASDPQGHPIRFRYDSVHETHSRDDAGQLIPDPDGRPFRQWRPNIRNPKDIWAEIQRTAELPGMTNASMLQPIETRRIMLQTGMRSAFGLKVAGPDLETIDRMGLEFERVLKQVPSVRSETVFADRVVGKPYLEIDIDRAAIARFGLSVRQVQDVIEVAIGGKVLTRTVEGRQRFPVRVRYQREQRDQIEQLGRVLVAGSNGTQIPLGQVAKIRYTPGPQNIRSEDTRLVNYVIFDKQPDAAEAEVVEDCRRVIEERIARGELTIPSGVSFWFAGTYENQVRAMNKLRVVLPLALFTIFLILYLQFRSVAVTLNVFSGVFVAWSGGFLMLWLYGQEWFLDFDILGRSMRDLFQVHPLNLSVAVWVGFLALFGIATDDG
ncbi:MAG: efflux RND transporter permease subunit, partial [Planctomycetes bacterium]|nr:efflux RND transporter permease subunit [Planctomycetota bacterium]